MKHVTKGVAPQSFEDWKALTNPAWQPSYDNLQNPQKRELHESLLIEQGWVCCYCGRSIDSRDSHIEHFRPQEHHEDLALSYDNLLASCIRETKPGSPLHCGHAKGSDFVESNHISPLDPQCETRFVYTLDGQVRASTAHDSSAEYMIELLRLDIEFLCNRRAAEIQQVFDTAFLATVTDTELRILRDGFRTRDDEGRLHGFGHVVARFAEQRLAD